MSPGLPEAAPAPIACGLCTATDVVTFCAHHGRIIAEHLPVLNRRLEAVFTEMRKDGQGLNLEQERSIKRALGIG